MAMRPFLGLFSTIYCKIRVAHIMGIVMVDISFIALDQSPIVSNPIEASFNLLSMPVAGASADQSSIPGSMRERRNHRLDALPAQKLAIGFANVKVPFFAGTKRSSIHACAHSILPWAFNRPITPAKSALTSQAWTKSRSVTGRLQVSHLRVAQLPERI